MISSGAMMRRTTHPCYHSAASASSSTLSLSQGDLHGYVHLESPGKVLADSEIGGRGHVGGHWPILFSGSVSTEF